MHNALLGGCYAAGVFAFDYTAESLGQVGMYLLNALTVFNNADGYLGSDEAENIEIEVDSFAYLDNVLFAVFVAGGILDECNLELIIIQF